MRDDREAACSALPFARSELPAAAAAVLRLGRGPPPGCALKGASLLDHGDRQQALQVKASTSMRLTWSATTVMPGSQITCSAVESGSSQSVREVDVASHLVGGSAMEC